MSDVALQVKLLPLLQDVPGVLQPLAFGHVRGVVHGAAFPYLTQSVKWDRHMQSNIGRVEMLRLWHQLVQVCLLAAPITTFFLTACVLCVCVRACCVYAGRRRVALTQACVS